MQTGADSAGEVTLRTDGSDLDQANIRLKDYDQHLLQS
jgi:hypothetical protein